MLRRKGVQRNLYEISQKKIKDNYQRIYGSNVEQYYTELIYIDEECVKILERRKITYFMWTHEPYHIRGQTNLSKKEFVELLKNIKFE